jgi:hypothetical protein
MRAAIAVVVSWLLAACAGAPSATTQTALPSVGATQTVPSTPSATASVPPTIRPLTVAPYTPGPAWEPFGDPIDVDSSVTTATVTEDGVRLTLSVPTAVVSAREAVWIETRLENVGENTLHWITDGCGIAVGVTARMALVWAYGSEQRGVFRVYKDWTLQLYGGRAAHPIGPATIPEPFADRGQYGCADLAVGHALAPGDRIDARALLDPRRSSYDFGVIPSGAVELTASFDLWWRGKDPGEDRPGNDSIAVLLPIEIIDGRDPSFISAGQAVDVALGVEMLQEQLRARPEVRWFAPTGIDFDEAAGTWTVGATFFADTPNERHVGIVVDARTAEITGTHEDP